MAVMLSTGHIPDLYTYGTLLNGYFKHGLVEEDMSLFHKLERKREDIGIAVYNVVINGLCKNGKVNEAHAIFEKLSFIGLLPDVKTYTVMINGFFLEGLLDEAKDAKKNGRQQLFSKQYYHHIRHILVVDETSMIGLESIGDVVRAIVSRNRDE
ncbi:hypothetical protein RND71_018860 [Anisodus tanguticus]|uniref:Pentatricopeptide repeat-containing protein n=1 Tax=Anisodus tanguticus TaxID=243964 RepID=A0AAE1S654_9SOLA|nr:hypothetical protein RND71_018860 [Anisodus tanguticus]